MGRSRISIVLYLALVFLSGVVVGAVGHRLYTMQTVSAAKARHPSPEEYRRRYLQEMQTRLKLTEEQVRKIDAVLDETRDRFRAEVRAMQEDQARRVRAILNPEQQEEYEKMRRERDERRKRSQKSHPGC